MNFWQNVVSHPITVSTDDGPRDSRTAASRVADGVRDAELLGQSRGELASGGQAFWLQVRLRTGRGTQEDVAGMPSPLIWADSWKPLLFGAALSMYYCLAR